MRSRTFPVFLITVFPETVEIGLLITNVSLKIREVS